MNLIILKGNLGKDVELKQTTSGKSVAKFSIGVSSGYGDKKETDWFDIVAWEKLGETAQKYLQKGSSVIVTGRVKFSEYENRDGVKVKKTEVIASNIEFLDKPKPQDRREPREPVDEPDIPF